MQTGRSKENKEGKEERRNILQEEKAKKQQVINYRGGILTTTESVAARSVDVSQALHLVISLLLAQLNCVAHTLRASILGAGAGLDRARLLSGGHSHAVLRVLLLQNIHHDQARFCR